MASFTERRLGFLRWTTLLFIAGLLLVAPGFAGTAAHEGLATLRTTHAVHSLSSKEAARGLSGSFEGCGDLLRSVSLC